MDTGALARAIRGSVEALGVPWTARRRVASPEELADRLAHTMQHFPDYATPQRLAGIIGESAQESDWFCTTREYGSGHRYAPYIGRGFIQLTHKSNYQRFTDWAYSARLIAESDLFVRDYWLVENLDWAWYPGAWFFSANGLGPYCDTGNWNAVSGMINGGNAGFVPRSANERKTAINGALRYLQGADLFIEEDDDMATYAGEIGEILTKVKELHSILGSQTVPRVNELAGEVRDADAITKIKDIHYVLGAQTNPAAEQARDGVHAIHSRIARLERAVAAARPAAAEILASNNEGEQQ